jgi:hypothetical protein
MRTIVSPSQFIEFIRECRTSSVRLSPLERSSIVVLHRLGLGPELIALLVERDVRTVHHWISHFDQHSNLDDEARSGRPPVTESSTEESIVALAREQPFLVPKDIKHMLVLAVSARTIRRRLDDAGLFGRIARLDYPYTPELIEARLKFARDYESWGEAEWGRVIFADEAYIYLGQHGQLWVQRPVDHEFILQYMAVTGPVNQKIGAWGAFSAKGTAPIHLYEDTMNMERLRRIFRTNLLPTAHQQFPLQQWFLLHDNAPYHTGGMMSEYIFNQGFEKIDIPRYSPDLNPMENMWAILKREVEAMNPVNDDQLRQFATDKWLAITPSMCHHLAASMPDRIKCVLACEGHRTGY